VRTADFNPDVAVDPSNGNLYIVWQDGRFSGGARSDIAFTMSTDGGNNWSPTAKLDQNSGGTSAFLPSVYVAADGTVGVSFYDFRNNTPDPGLPTDHWLLHCHADADCSNPDNWSENHVDGGFDTENFPTPGGRFFPGDYLGLTAIGNDFGSLYIKSDDTKRSADAWWATVGSP
jgi:hypothetical protein